jgi:hypothetical protein
MGGEAPSPPMPQPATQGDGLRRPRHALTASIVSPQQHVGLAVP